MRIGVFELSCRVGNTPFKGCGKGPKPSRIGDGNIVTRIDVDIFDCDLRTPSHTYSYTRASKDVDFGVQTFDFSADYRLDDVETYSEWYGGKHPDPDRVGKVAYGLPEFFKDQIPDAQLVANPGCFPTTAILAVAPLLCFTRFD